MKFSKSFPAINATSLCLLLGMLSVAHATISEPDNLIYGNITLDSVLVTAARTDVVIEARRVTNGPAVSSYRMGSDPALGNYYSLRLLLESVGPVSVTNASQISQIVFISVTDGNGLRAQSPFTFTDRGAVQRIDFGAVAVDSDGDGLPDAWELQRFGNLNQLPSSRTANGSTALENFIAGTDPNGDGFRLIIASTNHQKRVSFLALKAEGPGYEGMTRLYTLQSNATFAAGLWGNVPGFTDMTGNNQTVDYMTLGADPAAFFRGKVFLQGFTVPGADSDGDGLPDTWEAQSFGNLNQNASSVNANGRTSLQNFLAGTNPNDSNSAFRLSFTMNGNQREVSFQARRAQGSGYEGKSRYYSLLTSTNLSTWAGVTGFTNLLGDDQTITYNDSPSDARVFFCGQTWLQNQ